MSSARRDRWFRSRFGSGVVLLIASVTWSAWSASSLSRANSRPSSIWPAIQACAPLLIAGECIEPRAGFGRGCRNKRRRWVGVEPHLRQASRLLDRASDRVALPVGVSSAMLLLLMKAPRCRLTISAYFRFALRRKNPRLEFPAVSKVQQALADRWSADGSGVSHVA